MEAHHLRRTARDYGNGGAGLYGLRRWECRAAPKLAFMEEESGNGGLVWRVWQRLKVLGSRKIVQRGSRKKEKKQQRRGERLGRMSRSLRDC
jgi:hypothetical protein